jgi:WD40 repeat protein
MTYNLQGRFRENKMIKALTAVLCVLTLQLSAPITRAAEPKPRLQLGDKDTKDTRGPSRLAFSADGSLLAVFGGDKLTIWDSSTGKQTAGFAVHGPFAAYVPQQVAFAPDGKSVCTVDWKAGLQQFDLTGKLLSTYKPKDGYVDSIGFDDKGRVMAAVRYKKRVCVHDVTAEKDVFENKHSENVANVKISLDGKTLLASDILLDVRIWDVKSGKLLDTRRCPGRTGPREEFSPDGKLYGWGSGEKNFGGVVWDATTGLEIYSLPGPSNIAYAVAFDPSGKSFITGSTDGKVRVWDLKSKRSIATLPEQIGTIWDVTVSPDGKTLAEASNDTVRIWDMPTVK